MELMTFADRRFAPKVSNASNARSKLMSRISGRKRVSGPQGSGYLRFSPSASCGGGLGMMLSYLRTLLFFALSTI